MRHSSLALLVMLAACGTEVPEGDEAIAPAEGARDEDKDIKDRLAAIPGMTVKEELTAPAGHRFFSLTYEQPVHHWDASQGTFEQRLTILHRSETAPTVLAATGYDIRIAASRSEPTRLLEANQITVEQRFFDPSRPQGASWKRLNIQQAAADHHRIVSALRTIYKAPWVSTGASKGGMTSVYHRRFYPKDVAATVAYVAPHDDDQDVDTYAAFLDSVGTDAACREGLKRTQRAALEKRDEMLALMRDYATSNQLHYVGGEDRALEVMVLDTPFIFWQYGSQANCSRVPAEGAPASAIFRFLDQTVGVTSYAHEDADRYIPYYYQAGTQLGWPLVAQDHLVDLMKYPDAQDVRNYVPADIEMTYRASAMNDITQWLQSKGERILFIYGESDPWSAEKFEIGPGSKDCHFYVVPQGNHGSTIAKLPAAQRDEATGILRAWVGLDRQPDARAVAEVDGLDADWLMVDRPRL